MQSDSFRFDGFWRRQKRGIDDAGEERLRDQSQPAERDQLYVFRWIEPRSR